MAHFEPVSKYANADLPLPERKTKDSAGYDFVVAEDTVVPSYLKLMQGMKANIAIDESVPLCLNDMASITKSFGYKPTLVSTGMKCQLNPGTYLELSVRSSCPLKYWLIMANGVGIIDRDYWNNGDNEGEIFFQLINLSPFDIQLKKGDCVGQGIIKPYYTTEDDAAFGKREGGFGSTSK